MCGALPGLIFLCGMQNSLASARNNLWWLIFKLDSLVNFSVCEVYLVLCSGVIFFNAFKTSIEAMLPIFGV